ncbi:hypothetical protein LEN26_014964 [Aphanomyces euteiches]|nr:hypothetical protein LEN26_014964 [Aphanomyces euteiches]KAH9128012.1 hypothetical protein AeMF1_001755 [Aphanomyces euteiches]KAH9191857.1 hypothetical protein AeNC1_006164 [Aphanomyces euteiches]
MLQRALKKGLPMPLCALLLSFDFLSKFVPTESLAGWRHFYAGTNPKLLEAKSPGLHSVAGLPPMFVVNSLEELYGPDIAQFVTNTASEGVAVESLAHPYLFNVYAMLLVSHPASMKLSKPRLAFMPSCWLHRSRNSTFNQDKNSVAAGILLRIDGNGE